MWDVYDRYRIQKIVKIICKFKTLIMPALKCMRIVSKRILKPLVGVTDKTYYRLDPMGLLYSLEKYRYLVKPFSVQPVVCSDCYRKFIGIFNEFAISPLILARKQCLSTNGNGNNGDTAEKQSKVIKVKKKKSVEYNYTDNIFILPIRAIQDYLLTTEDLEKLPKYLRRSPYLYGPPIVLYLRSDVEKRAIKVWGSLEKMKQKKNRMHVNDGMYEDREKFTLLTDSTRRSEGQFRKFRKSGPGRVVLTAIIVNGLNCFIKCIAWLYTGSSSMFSEFIHSLADTINQIVLGFGLYQSIKEPDTTHPYGYQNLRYISSLISGVGIFCFGTGISWYHGFLTFFSTEPLGPLFWAIATLVGSFISEGASLFIAINQTRKSAKEKNLSFIDFVLEGHDPSVNVVLLEDLAAVLGVTIAATCMTLTQYTGLSFYDSLGSLLIGGILGGVATFIIYTNTNSLVGRSISFELKDKITLSLECDRMIRSLHDVKATQMGGQIRFKAEIDFDGREITRAYLYKLDLEQLLKEMHELKTSEEVESFMLRHGTEIIDNLGAEVDRIEKVLKKAYPTLRHVDLEAL